MAWRPVQHKQTGLRPQAREVVSRMTMVFIATALFFAAYRCFDFARRRRAEQQSRHWLGRTYATRHPDKGSAALPSTGCVACALLGLALGGCAVVTPTFLEQFDAPPGDPHDEADRLQRRTRRGGF